MAEVSLSKIVQNLSFRYTRWINRKQKRLGHLFQGRYKAILVERDAYLLELVRYIHLNPVRARLVKEASAYPWSSHRAYLGQADLPWLTMDVVLGQFSKRISTARKGYDEFIKGGIGEGYREEFYKGAEDSRILGEDRFVEQILGKVNERVPKSPPLAALEWRVSQMYGILTEELSSPGRSRHLAEARGVVAWLAVNLGSGNLREIGERFRRDGSAMSVAMRRIEHRAKASRGFHHQLQGLIEYNYSTFQA